MPRPNKSFNPPPQPSPSKRRSPRRRRRLRKRDQRVWLNRLRALLPRKQPRPPQGSATGLSLLRKFRRSTCRVPTGPSTPRRLCPRTCPRPSAMSRRSKASIRRLPPTLRRSQPIQVGLSSSYGTIDASETVSAHMSSAVSDEPQVESFDTQVAADAPKIAIDPLMAEGGSKARSGTSFSEISELPPLKEVYVPPPPPPPPPPSSFQPVQSAGPTATVFKASRKIEEKPRVQPREVAEKAIKEIKNVPPKLMLYALAGAGILILIIGIGVTIYVHSLNGDDDSGAGRSDRKSTRLNSSHR